MHDQNCDALKACVKAMLQANGGFVHSVQQLAAMVTKADRFLFPYDRYRMGRESQEERNETMARQSDVTVSLLNGYVRPVTRAALRDTDNDE